MDDLVWDGDNVRVYRVFGQRNFDLFGLNFMGSLRMFVVMTVFLEVLSPWVMLLVLTCFLSAMRVVVSFCGLSMVMIRVEMLCFFVGLGVIEFLDLPGASLIGHEAFILAPFLIRGGILGNFILIITHFSDINQ
jgi:hypothetical protein